MLPGIYDAIKRLSNASLYYLVCDIEQKKETGKWPKGSQTEYYIEDFKSKFGLYEPEIESMVADAAIKASGKRFKKLYEGMKDIEYESSPGAHTRHQCDCGRSSCRRQCVRCIVESCSK